jgi:hypothetical protein
LCIWDEEWTENSLLYWNSGGASKTEVAQLQFAITVDEEILWLQISAVMVNIKKYL